MTIIFRADANADIGWGHASRCLALAQEIRSISDQRVIWISKELDTYFQTELKVMGIEVLHAEQFDKAPVFVSNKLQANIVIKDHYGLDESWNEKFTKTDISLVVFEDDRVGQPSAALRINAGRPREEGETAGKKGEGCLFGLRYSIVNPIFKLFPSKSSPREGRPELLISLGGGDISDHVSKLKTEIEPLKLEFEKIVFATNRPNLLAHLTVEGAFEIAEAAGQSDMANLMQQADIIVSAGGVTAVEAATIGRPLILIPRAENQRDQIQLMVEEGIALKTVGPDCATFGQTLKECLDRYLTDQAFREKQVLACRQSADGLGANRVAKKIIALLEAA